MYGPIDVQLLLRDISDGAETTTVDETGVTFDPGAHQDFKAVVHVSSLDTADADETYALVVDVDSVAAFTDAPVEVGRLSISSPGTYEIPLSGAYIQHLDGNAGAIRVGLEVGGTTPSITYGAFIAPVV